MVRLASIAVLAGLMAAAMPGGAMAQPQLEPQVQDAPPRAPEDSARYSFHRMGDRFLRLDSHTGQVAQCGWSNTGWACNMAPDERAALENEIARIQKENAALKKSLLSHGIELPANTKPDVTARKDEAPARKEELNPRMPSEADLDRAIGFMRQIWRRLVELMVDFQRDMQRKS